VTLTACAGPRAVGYDPADRVSHSPGKVGAAGGARTRRKAEDRMSGDRRALLRRRLTKLWLFSPEKLWLASIALHRRGHGALAFALKQLNTVLYHNSLAPGARVGAEITLGHYGHGIVVHENVEIGRGVTIWHNVTLTAGRPARRNRASPGPKARITVGDYVKIGTNAVVIAPRGRTLRIGRGARIGAGAIVTGDVPAGATVVSPPARILLDGVEVEPPDDAGAEAGVAEPSGHAATGEPPVRFKSSGADDVIRHRDPPTR
jgi:serine O-acetyltransferase